MVDPRSFLIEHRWISVVRLPVGSLAALQARINPHFFFNTLNTISSLLDDDTDQAEEVLQTLSDMFRYTFVAADGPVRLDAELDFTRSYVTIEQARFGERLCVEWEIEPAAAEIRVPGTPADATRESHVHPTTRSGTNRERAARMDERLTEVCGFSSNFSRRPSFSIG